MTLNATAATARDGSKYAPNYPQRQREARRQRRRDGISTGIMRTLARACSVRTRVINGEYRRAVAMERNRAEWLPSLAVAAVARGGSHG